jgi:hypothetical protein
MRKAQQPAARKKTVAHMSKGTRSAMGKQSASMSRPSASKPGARATRPRMTKPGTAQAGMTKPRMTMAQRSRMTRVAPKTRAELYDMARQCDLPGRSKMGRAQLARMLGER